MQFFKTTTNYDFMGKRRTFALLSTVLVVLSAAATLFIGPKFGIDFAGGTEIQVSFEKPVSSGDIRATLERIGFPGADVVTFGAHESEFLVRLQAISPVTEQLAAAAEQAVKQKFAGNEVSRFEFSPGGDKLTVRLAEEVAIADLEAALKEAGVALAPAEIVRMNAAAEAQGEGDSGETESERSKRCEGVTCTWESNELRVYEISLEGVAERVMEALRAEPYGAGAQKMRSEWVGPKVGQQLRSAGIYSLLYALMFIMLYIAVRFDLRFAPGAVVALIHDIVITMGVFTLARVEVTLATVAALLTIVGYSLNDTIVVFDRIRENLSKIRDRRLSQVVNTSVNETLSRTVLTSLTTLLVVAVILTVGWKTTIRDFAFALLIGVVVGTYSSIFIASPVVVWLDSYLNKKKA